MVTGVQRTLVTSERVRKNGKLYYRLYFYDHAEGVIIKVLSPVVDNDVVITNEEFKYAI